VYYTKVVEFNSSIPIKLVWYFSEFSMIFYEFLKFTAFEIEGGWNLAETPLTVLKSLHLYPWLVGEEEQRRCRLNSGKETARGRRRSGWRAPGGQGAPAGSSGRRRR
jgi:hypothetical protein